MGPAAAIGGHRKGSPCAGGPGEGGLRARESSALQPEVRLERNAALRSQTVAHRLDPPPRQQLLERRVARRAMATGICQISARHQDLLLPADLGAGVCRALL